jgi:hypothetical protein
MNTFPKKSKLSVIPDQQATVSQISVPQTSPGFSIPHIKDESINRTSAAISKPAPPVSNANAISAQVQEEKRQAVRKLIESIPTKKEDLFAFPLDWSLLDAVCILSLFLLINFSFKLFRI